MRISASVALLLLAGASLPVRGDETEMARFKRDFPEAARRLEERFAHAKGSCILQRGSTGEAAGARPGTVDEADFAIDHGYEKVTVRRKPLGSGPRPPLVEFIYCVGKDTDFHIVRPAGATNYTVEGIGTTPAQRSAYIKLFGRFAKAHQGVLVQPMSQVMASPGFRLKDAERVTKDGRSLVKVDYEVGDKEPKNQVSVVLDPDAGWVVRSSEYRPGAAPEIRFLADVTYGPARDGMPLPRRVTLRDHTGESSCEFTNWSFEPTPLAEFGMPFYGLPDLTAKVDRRRSTLPYWLVGLAVAGVSLAFILRRLGR